MDLVVLGLGLVAVAIGLGLYVLPSTIASMRNHPQLVPIMILNMLLGWTFVGWVAALVWASTRQTDH